jgi:hypothetical protein
MGFGQIVLGNTEDSVHLHLNTMNIHVRKRVVLWVVVNMNHYMDIKTRYLPLLPTSRNISYYGIQTLLIQVQRPTHSS